MKQRTYAIAAAITALMIASAPAATAQELPDGLAGRPVRVSGRATAKLSRQEADRDSAVIIIDRRVAAKDELQAVKTEQIKEFSMLKMGDSRLIEVTTYKGFKSGDNTSPLILLNGLEIDSLQQVRQEFVQSVESLQPDEAAAIYGERGARGAVMITMHPTYNGKPVTLRDALSGNRQKDSSKPGAKDVIQVIGVKGIRKDYTSEQDTVSAAPTTAAQPLTIGRAEGDEATYLIPDINRIKPEDIASVMVIHQKSAHLFDAYGDTSGGVILITFKKGRMPLSDVVKAEKK